MARIHFKNGHFLGYGTWDERHLWKNAGFRWSPVRKAWITEQVEVAQAVKGVPWTPQAMAEIENRLAVAESSIKLSYASDTVFEPPVPPGLHPRTGKPFAFFPYQKAGIEYAIQRKDTLIADQPGLGKSPMGVGVFNADPAARRVLIICPASLKEHWRREFELWKTKPVTVGIAETKYREKFQDGFTKPRRKGEQGKPKFKTVVHDRWWPKTDVVIINYDILGKFADEINAQPWDLLICDEAHALKTEDSGRTLFVLGGMKRNASTGWKTVWYNAIEANRRVFLTGTPMMNRPIELWPLCKAFDPSGLGKDKTAYGYRYCAGFWDQSKGGFNKAGRRRGGYNFDGASNEEELGQELRAAFMIRRLKREVLPELPPKFRQVIVLDSPEIKEIVARENELAEALKLFEDIVRYPNETEAERDDRIAREIEERASALGIPNALYDPDKPMSRALNMEYAQAVLGLEPPAVAAAFEEIAKVRRELGMAKLSAVVPWVKAYLDGGEKLIVFAYHTDVVLALADALADYNPAVLWGGVPSRKRQVEVDKFQNDPSCRVIVLQIDVGGEGYTLTAAHDVCFAEGDWRPTKMEQAFDRVCRIGQLATKLMGFMLVANGSLDCRMAQKSYDKETVISAVLDS